MCVAKPANNSLPPCGPCLPIESSVRNAETCGRQSLLNILDVSSNWGQRACEPKMSVLTVQRGVRRIYSERSLEGGWLALSHGVMDYTGA